MTGAPTLAGRSVRNAARWWRATRGRRCSTSQCGRLRCCRGRWRERGFCDLHPRLPGASVAAGERRRGDSGVTPAAVSRPCSDAPVEQVERAYKRFLVDERGVSSATVTNYLPIVRAFLAENFGSHEVALESLGVRDANQFVVREARRLSRSRAGRHQGKVAETPQPHRDSNRLQSHQSRTRATRKPRRSPRRVARSELRVPGWRSSAGASQEPPR